jgi:4'-phosphopantetheinyl transferase
LTPSNLDLWWASLECDATHILELTALLSAEEHSRIARIYSAAAKRRALVSRGLLRSVLAQYLDCPPGAVPLVRQPSGKPSLAAHGKDLSFNLSHSGEGLIIAIASRTEVGVDIEKPRAVHEPCAIAQRMFPRPYADRVCRGSAADRSERFLRMWTVFEAQLKLDGRGVGVDVPAVPPPNARTIALRLPHGYVGALAYYGERRQLRCYDAWRIGEIPAR